MLCYRGLVKSFGLKAHKKTRENKKKSKDNRNGELEECLIDDDDRMSCCTDKSQCKIPTELLLAYNYPTKNECDDWELKSVWGKDIHDWNILDPNLITEVEKIENPTKTSNSPNLIDIGFTNFTPEVLLKFSTNSSSNTSIHETENSSNEFIGNFYEGNNLSGHTSDTGLCTDSESSLCSKQTGNSNTAPSSRQNSLDNVNCDNEFHKNNNNSTVYELSCQSGVRNVKDKQTTRLGLNRETEYAEDKLEVLTKQYDAEIQEQKKKFENHITALQQNNQKALEVQRSELEQRLVEIREEFDKERECYKEEIHEIVRKHEAQLVQLEKRFQDEFSQIKKMHEQKLEAQRNELEQKYIDLRMEYDQEREFQKDEIKSLQKMHEEELIQLQEQFDQEVLEMNIKHDAELVELRNDLELKHLDECSRLEDKYNSELHAIKLKTNEPVDSINLLTGQPSDILLKEVDSLRYVVDMKQNNLKELHKELMKHKLLCEELSGVETQNLSLQAKVEDLEAQLEKSRQDKSKLLENLQNLESNLKSVEVENDKLHLHNEELKWRIQNMNVEQKLVESN